MGKPAITCAADKGGSLSSPQADMSISTIQRKDGDMAEKSKRHEANAQFAKLQRAEDAKKATELHKRSDGFLFPSVYKQLNSNGR